MAQPIPRTEEPDVLSASAPLRVAVIGVGRIGRMHAELLAARVPGVALAAVCDAAPDTARAVADRLGVDVAVGVDEVLGAEDVDAVAICSSTPTHAELIARAAAAGKAILCEKPVSLDLEELDRALAEVTRAGVPFQMASTAVSTPPIRRCATRSPTARSASPISLGSRVATLHRRGSSTPGSPAGCSST
jgi:predicted dehydrogenase